LKKSDRRKSTMDAPAENDEERRARHEERRTMRASEAPKPSRRRSAPVVDSYFDPRAAEPVYKDSKRKKAGWPHSGTDSWVKEHSDAPPPPEDETPIDAGAVDEEARRELRKSRRTSRYDDMTAEDQEARTRRREARRAEKDAMRSSEGSQGEVRRPSRRDSAFVEKVLPRTDSTQRGSWWKKIAGAV